MFHPTRNERKTIYLTFDVEDYFQVENLRKEFPFPTWEDVEIRVVPNVARILDILSTYRVKATFFILGWIAEKAPSVVREIVNKGHEIASHGYYHNSNLSISMTREELKSDIDTSKALLEKLSGERIIGYRAPNFSISEELLYLIKDLGFEYDSSYNPCSWNSRYGRLPKCHDSDPFVHISGVREIPIPVATVNGREIPIGGGFFFRFLPLPIFEKLTCKYLQEHDSFVLYLHPWEIDPNQPRVQGLRWDYAFRHYYGIAGTESKLRRFIEKHHDACLFSTLDRYFERQG